MTSTAKAWLAVFLVLPVSLVGCQAHGCACFGSGSSGRVAIPDAADPPALTASDDGPLPCQHDPEGSAETVDDRRILRQLDRLATEHFENKSFTPMAELRAQLESRSTCDLVLPSPKQDPLTASALFLQRADSVLIVGHLFECDRCDRRHVGPGSGVVLTADGVGATNYHVFEQDTAETMVVATRDGRVYPIEEVLAASRADDVAIFRIDAENLTPAPIRPDAPVGTPAWVISHPARRFYTFTDGMVSRYFEIRHQGQAVPMMSITADYARGSSGGPVFDDGGNVIGLVARTESMYYSVEDRVQRDLQMVIKQCVPARSLLDRIDSPDQE